MGEEIYTYSAKLWDKRRRRYYSNNWPKFHRVLSAHEAILGPACRTNILQLIPRADVHNSSDFASHYMPRVIYAYWELQICLLGIT